ncbi:Rieske 2Fe-2S domain-containing protein [Brevibacterium sp. 50QC2O2]|jgi:ubiquinol-cytochrome c reductase iron-sulfur subunit|uniref:cytochrome bc1 complex Rieske iron-sulfur subunit n=1 Tax=Brevibacterium TaxID=1696 RepID=UPI00211C019E|nr:MULTISPECIES: Rieske 2Fe-2S domain-containing protein [unclassified Brevibacterium]MCQ9366694.1 Rieske 2Fe-2S domain-containing protein [Brevibacterium sp. 91QC2O2]MCQ9384329.1 Rieske 2Fe-2S domain-containing protein [Brevibacterium sp. 68QC2CO]MCQ9388948.1 Rieske 2Fe-2S domain-containing protein [Brevibacterium sp. 50QC2O2]
MSSNQHSGSTAGELEVVNGFENPGLPEHKPRITDVEPAAEKVAERQIAAWFLLSMVGTIWFIVSYFLFPLDGQIGSVRMQNTMLGIGLTVALFSIGIGIILWAKTLITDAEVSEDRHSIPGSEEDQAIAIEIFNQAKNESGIARRPLIRNMLIAAVAIAPLPAILVLRDLGPLPGNKMFETLWGPGVRLCKDTGGVPSVETPIKASDVTIGSAFHVIPEGMNKSEDPLNEKAKAAVLLMRVDPEQLNTKPERESWQVDGIVAYSKICTHVGCPVALYEHQTHHLLCPCHQSTFDVTNHCKVIFGPAKRPLPQLPIKVDSDGYLVAQRDFTEPVGPSFWEVHTRETESR